MLLHRFLDGDKAVEMPEQLIVGDLCEEFGVLPRALEEEIAHTPVGYLMDIVTHRRYARLKGEYDALCAAGDKRCNDARFTQIVLNEIALMKGDVD